MPDEAYRYKVTIGFRIAARGGSESYISSERTAKDASEKIEKLIRERVKGMHSAVEVDAVRFARLDPSQKRRSVAYPPGTRYPLDKPNAAGVGGTPVAIPASGFWVADGWLPDQANSCLLSRVTFDGDRNAPHYMFGTPDSVLGKEPQSYLPGEFPLYAEWLKSFRSLLISDGWSIKARRRDTGYGVVPIVRWTVAGASPANIGVVVNTGAGISFAQRDLVQILSSRRKGTDKMTYNGSYFVYATAAGPDAGQLTIFLDGTSAGDPASIKRPGFIQKIGHTYYPIQDLEGIKAVTRKRGRPFGQGRGNKQSRVSLDP